MIRLLDGDCRAILPTLAAGSVQCVVTSPPYFGQRDFHHPHQIGQETSPTDYVAQLVRVFRAVYRVLRDDGVCWIVLGDSYGRGDAGPSKQLMMMPARVAIALQDDGWYLRSDCIWHKNNGLPENVTDRPTGVHDYIYLLSKAPTYFYDGDAVREVAVEPERIRADRVGGASHVQRQQHSKGGLFLGAHTRNLRSVWTINTAPFHGPHFATMPPDLAKRCIMAGSRPGDTVLDPFSGAGTTALVADRHHRAAVGIEINPAYAAMARDRIFFDNPLFVEIVSG